MNSNRSKLEVILSPGFLVALALLLINDFYLKQAFGNFLTGKLSDFAGLFTLSIFLSAIFRQRARLWIHALVGVAFVVWKTRLVNPLIGAWNSLGILFIERTVDYSDYVALAVLPLSYLYLRERPSARQHEGARRAVSYVVLIISVFAFTATSSSTYRSVTVEQSYAVRENRVKIESLLLKDPAIKNFVPRTTPKGEKIGNFELEESLYYFDLEVDERTCDSPRTKMSFMVTDRSDRTELYAISISFKCAAYSRAENINGLDITNIEHAREIFERRILVKLSQIDP